MKTPAPTSPSTFACSKTVTSTPRRQRALATARPPMPPPTMAVRRRAVDVVSFMVSDLYGIHINPQPPQMAITFRHRGVHCGCRDLGKLRMAASVTTMPCNGARARGLESTCCRFLIEHDLFGKQVTT